MLIAFGQPAFSDFRLQQKLAQLQNISIDVEKLTAHEIFFIQSDSLLTADEKHKIESLLQARFEQSCSAKGEDSIFDAFRVAARRSEAGSAEHTSAYVSTDGEEQQSCSAKGEEYIVFPRIGTISPWSSKAQDIFKHCGLNKINRVEHGIYYQIKFSKPTNEANLNQIQNALYDPLTESLVKNYADVAATLTEIVSPTYREIDLMGCGKKALTEANIQYGLALSAIDIDYLYDNFLALKRNPHDVELMMYGQVNSEHCRHKIFNAQWQIDGKPQAHSLFAMIKHTHFAHPGIVKVAYLDNASTLQGEVASRWLIDSQTQAYHFVKEAADFCIKVETHNHPTAISPWPGAATGSGGEIRDEAATGQGACPKAGVVGYSVSHLRVPALAQPWEQNRPQPQHLASPLDIMLQAPMGACSFNNEFGRPNIGGYFRTFEYQDRGYAKPIMIAGGLGQIRPQHTHKKEVRDGNLVIVLGGPGMSIGLGGGAASSLTSGVQSAELDFASVQRANPEMQRRAQEVVNACVSLGENNPIVSIHDVGAGGLCNAVPELAHHSGCGVKIELRSILCDESGMSPLAIWCNESQERYVLAIEEKNLNQFDEIAQRERCPYAVIGSITAEPHLMVGDAAFDNFPIDISMDLLFSSAPRMDKFGQTQALHYSAFNDAEIDLTDAIERVLQFPSVADKKFLITLGDRSVTGLVARDQLVGPWQVAVADVAVTANSFIEYQGEAMAMGERPPLALLSPEASVRMAIGEALTNLIAADVPQLKHVALSANWMAASGTAEEDGALYAGVKAASECCQALGISIPVGKDSLSMRSRWQDADSQHEISSPLSLVVSAFSPVADVRKTLTPQLHPEQNTQLIFIALSDLHRLGGCVLAEVYQALGVVAPVLVSPEILISFYHVLQLLREKNLILAYHDRSDGGLFATLCEMAFAGHCGIDIDLTALGHEMISILFNEELGAVIEVTTPQTKEVLALLHHHGFAQHSFVIGLVKPDDEIQFSFQRKIIYRQSRMYLQQLWSKLSYHLQSLRDDPKCAQEEYALIQEKNDPGLHVHFTFNPDEDICAPYLNLPHPPKVAILREQGVNGHYEMAAAFQQAGFAPIDVHMSDLINEKINLKDFVGIAACGGFSYGDVLGAGRGWAQTILHHPGLLAMFQQFFERENTFTLGVCNGCQMLAHLTSLIPGSHHWPIFTRNRSEQFEARLSMVEILDSPSIFLKDMAGSRFPVVVSHGEGQAKFANPTNLTALFADKQASMRYVDHHGQPTQHYPYNPNGSPEGLAALTSADGRVLLMMPHPERVFLTRQFSWYPHHASQQSPWLRLFMNARQFVV